MKLRSVIGLLAAGLTLAACATTTAPETAVGWQARHAAGEAAREAVRFADTPLPLAWSPAPVTTTPIEINDAALAAGTGGLRFAGGVHITSDFGRLHGLSDLVFQDAERFLSISDEGLLVRGRIELDGEGRLVGLTGVEARPLVDPDGLAMIPKVLADAEGLALLPDGELLVSFEREHRVWRYDPNDGHYLGERVIPDFAFTENEGMEGIAPAGSGEDFWASGENGGVWLCRVEACEVMMAPPETPLTDRELRVTSLDIDPASGDLVVLQRAFDETTVQTTIRLSLWSDLRRPRPQPDRELATFTNPAAVDNFEGVAAVRRPDGGIRLYILSDDNFSENQRTLLLAFDVVR